MQPALRAALISLWTLIATSRCSGALASAGFARFSRNGLTARIEYAHYESSSRFEYFYGFERKDRLDLTLAWTVSVRADQSASVGVVSRASHAGARSTPNSCSQASTGGSGCGLSATGPRALAPWSACTDNGMKNNDPSSIPSGSLICVWDSFMH